MRNKTGPPLGSYNLRQATAQRAASGVGMQESKNFLLAEAAWV